MNFNPIVAQGVGFEPTWVAPNGFQDRRVMTASLTLRVNLLRYYTPLCVNCQGVFKTFAKKSKFSYDLYFYWTIDFIYDIINVIIFEGS